MKLDEFRSTLESYRRDAGNEAISLKQSQIVPAKLCALYDEFDDSERHLANQIFSEWVLSDDEGQRFDALALIDSLNITSAIPFLHRLTERLKSSAEPSAPYESKKVERILRKLGALG